MSQRNRIAQNLQLVQSRIERACERAGRSTDSVRLIAVTKYAELDWIRDLVQLGQTRLGESRPQQLARRAAEFSDPTAAAGSPVEWHMIGHLQRNKVEQILAVAALTHSIDSERLLRRVSEVATKMQIRAAVLLEVNVSGEASKDGFNAADVVQLWPELSALPGLRIDGLMTMAPLSDQPEEARPVFAKLRELRDSLRAECPAGPSLPELSMGMSGDFEAGIAEGATLVRIGSALFNGLTPAADSLRASDERIPATHP